MDRDKLFVLYCYSLADNGNQLGQETLHSTHSLQVSLEDIIQANLGREA